ncbi:hypothetical protein J1N35_028281 [Gossypium stocksii]|uniref:Uncharacterized protein n=1 Tax=Gossypium stocksii TaxID=47602 RepID=A0A9D3ZRU2_9ROSI|nr:hypothetical protein J1N35_028281 [Gossypium stocksii]
MIACKCSLDHVDDQATAVLLANAHLLMCCRSTPTKSGLEENNRVKEDEEDQRDEQECKRKNEEKRKKFEVFNGRRKHEGEKELSSDEI